MAPVTLAQLAKDSQGATDEIKKAVKGFERAERRLVQSIGTLEQALTNFQPDAQDSDFDEVCRAKNEAEKAFRYFTDGFEKLRCLIDEDLDDESENTSFYGALMICNDKMSVDFAKAISSYDQKRPAAKTARSLRYTKLLKEREQRQAEMVLKKAAVEAVNSDLNKTVDVVKQLDLELQKLVSEKGPEDDIDPLLVGNKENIVGGVNNAAVTTDNPPSTSKQQQQPLPPLPPQQENPPPFPLQQNLLQQNPLAQSQPLLQQQQRRGFPSLFRSLFTASTAAFFRVISACLCSLSFSSFL